MSNPMIKLKDGTMVSYSDIQKRGISINEVSEECRSIFKAVQ